VKKPHASAGFDFVNAHHGYWAMLKDGAGRTVVLTAWPATLLSMYRAGMLAGTAKSEAEALDRAERYSVI
jgi:hypothetical protein